MNPKPFSRPAFRRLLTWTLLLPLLLVSVLAGLLLWQVAHLLSITRWVDRTDRTIAQANEVQKVLLDMETGYRGYLLTSMPEFLDPYIQSGNQLDDSLGKLKLMASNRPEQQKWVDDLFNASVVWQQRTRLSIADKRLRKETPSADYLRGNKLLMDQMREIILELIRSEEAIRENQRQIARRAVTETFWGGGLLFLVTGGVLAFFTRNQILQVSFTYEEALEMAHNREDLLKEADERKDHFLALLGHELRNPLNTLSTALHTLVMLSEENPAALRLKDVVDRQVKRMTVMLDDLQDVSRIANNKISLNLQPLDLSDLIRHVVDDLRPALADAELHIRTQLPSEPVRVKGDAARLSQVFINLLQNGIKYTDPGGEIEVRLLCNDGYVQVEVQDTGVGIAPDLLPHLFESFTQAEEDRNRSQGGLGLGLALVKGLVEMHWGTVSLQSEGRGRGTRVTIRLPLLPEVNEPGD